MNRVRRAALILGLVGLAGLLLLLASGGRGTNRSTRDRGPEGTAALAGVFERLGFPVDSLRLGLHVLPRTPSSLLILASPPGLVAWPPLTEPDAERVLDWARRGGVVVHLTDRQDALVSALGLTLDSSALPRLPAGAVTRRAMPTRPAVWTRGGPLAVGGRAGLVDGVSEPLFVVGDTVVASLHRRGRGAVLVVSDPTIASNASLSGAGNLDLLVHLAEHAVPPGEPVLFDDLHAGGGDGHGVIAYARRSGASGAVLVGALALVLLLWRLAGRASPPASPVPPRQIGGAADYVRALAGLYDRAELSRHALAVISRQFRRAIEERARIPWEHEALQAWLEDELGGEAAAEFVAVRDRFALQFREQEPQLEGVLAAARLAAGFEARWLRRPISRPLPRPGSR